MRKKLAAGLATILAACSGSTGTAPANSPNGTSPAPVASQTANDPLTCWTADGGGQATAVVFSDVTADLDLIDPLVGMHGHAAIWTDVDGNDRPDILVGTFADRDTDVYKERGASGPSPDRMLLGGEGGFTQDASLPEAFSRTSGGATVDLDNDGDLDLVVSRNIKDKELGQPPTQILENDAGRLRVVESAGIPDEFGGRSVGVLDYDRDGLNDLFIVEDRFTGGSSVLLHNDGGLSFRDTTANTGIPSDVHGLGVVVADFDADGSQDLFVSGSNRLFLADGSGRFDESDADVFEWETYGDEDDIAGASAADVNRDGLLDLAIGQHYNSTVDFGERVSVRLYLNRGEGEFDDVTEAAGLTPLPTKAPHVELNDFNNDGWVDLLTSASAGDGPALFLNDGVEGDVPQFGTPDGLGDAQYWVGAPSADYDRDGRLDVFLLEWEPSLPSLLLRNETESGNWLEVSVGAELGNGIGWRVEVRHDGELVGARDITVTQGYSAGVLPVAHFGLGDAETVDVRLVPADGSEPITLGDVTANQHLRWPNGCS